MIWLGIFIGGAIGSWLGALLTHNNYLSGWSIIMGGIGSIAGVYAGYKLGRMIEG